MRNVSFAAALALTSSVTFAAGAAEAVDDSAGRHVAGSSSWPTDKSWLWVLGGAGLGGGSGPFSGFYAVATASAVVWPLDNIGANAVIGGLSAGAPDGPGAEGSYWGAGLSLRARLDESKNPWWIFLLVSAGSAHVNGYTRYSDDKTRFDYRDFVVSSRGGFVGSLGPLIGGFGVQWDTMPGHGYAIVFPALFGGFTF